MFHDDQNHCADCGQSLLTQITYRILEKIYCKKCLPKYSIPVWISNESIAPRELIKKYSGNLEKINNGPNWDVVARAQEILKTPADDSIWATSFRSDILPSLPSGYEYFDGVIVQIEDYQI